MTSKALIPVTTVLLLASSVSQAYAQRSEKVSVVWCDPLLNVRDLHSLTGIAKIVDKVESSGIGAIALGVKAGNGQVIYDSNIAPRLTEWEGYQVSFDVDPVQALIEQGKNRQIQIYAVFSVFSEGHIMSRQGPIFDERSEWQSQVYVVENEKPGIIPTTQWAYGTTAFVNPLSKEVQEYESSVIKEFLQRYSVDGIILDKTRFSGIESDFSESSKIQFESFLGAGRSLQWWPEDVYELRFDNEEWQIVPGTYYQEWLQFRSQSMHGFMKSLIGMIKEADPALPVGKFVGAWYPTYYEYGVNWASEQTIAEEDWAPSEYYKTAIAEMLDYLIVGCFFPRITIEETEEDGAEWWMSTEGSAMLSMDVVNNVCPVYGAILLELFKNDPARLKQALRTAMSHTNGLYLYDLSHIESYKLWDEIREVLSNP
ncbi:family 10 glycosylhydrolase [bacterium]|nr:family 10 glycosylhydrolase [bacterium]